MATQVINQVGIAKFEIDSLEANKTTDLINIPDAEHNPHIIALARYAVEEYYKDGRKMLFAKVIRAAKRLLPGFVLYYITLEVSHPIITLVNVECEAKVAEVGQHKKLIDFKELGPIA